MHNHYLPQKYLLRFADNDGGVWVHDNQKTESYRTGPKVIGNEIGMYSDEVEVGLNMQVEGPTHRVFDKIIAKRPLTSDDCRALAKYICVMYKRVPSGRDRAMALMPQVADDLHADIMAELDTLVEIDPTNRVTADSLRVQTSDAIERLKVALPPSLWYKGFNLNDIGAVEEGLLSMNWVFLCSDRHQFLTSDNPVSFFKHEGIGSPQSELTFPLSSSVTLWATRRPRKHIEYVTALPAGVKEINRRTASNSKRFLFSKTNELWIKPFSVKGSWPLSRLV